MTAFLIDGRAHARDLKASLVSRIAALKARAVTPGLAAILVGDNPSSQVYVRSKCLQCEEVGIRSFPHYLPQDISPEALQDLIQRLNADPAVHGILLQLPLPKGFNTRGFIEAISPHKDVDGLTLTNMGRLMAGLPGRVPCTPKGCMKLIQSVQPELSGLHAVVVGRSHLVGGPMAQLLLQANCSVSVVHSRSRNPEALARQGDILVVAAGVPHLVNASWIKPGAVVIDVGIHTIEENHQRRLTGDVDFEAVRHVARALTPVPGGVGPMTVACLLENTVEIAEGTLS